MPDKYLERIEVAQQRRRHCPRVTAWRRAILKSIWRRRRGELERRCGVYPTVRRHGFSWRSKASAAAVPRTGWTACHLVLQDSLARLVARCRYTGRGIRAANSSSIFPGQNATPSTTSSIPEAADRDTLHAGPRARARSSGGAEPGVTAALIQAAAGYARSEQLSSWHVLFPQRR